MASSGAVPEQAAQREDAVEHPTEHSPLLPRGEDADNDPAHSPPSEDHTGKSRLKRWPSLLALLVLCVTVVVILVAVFLAPQVLSEYAKDAVVFEPTSLSVASFTATGAVARVQGLFSMDASRVGNRHVRNLGRFGTYIARMIETEQTTVKVSFPEYGNPVVGTAILPPIRLNVQNGHTTGVDVLVPLTPGSVEAIRRVADDWVNGKLGQLRVQGKADVKLHSGLLVLPSQTLIHSLVFEDQDVPNVPEFDILRLNVHEEERPDGNRGLTADAAIRIANAYPVDFTVPPLGFSILVPACTPADPYIDMATATTSTLSVKPKKAITLNVTGAIRHLPKEAVTACPGTVESPLDVLLGNYIHGQPSTVYVRGAGSPSEETPQWLTDLISDVTVPVPLRGRTFGHLIKNFTLSDVHLDLPDLFAEPDTPDSKPRVSAKMKALVALPDEINFKVAADRVRAEAHVYYKHKRFGDLDLHEWQKAESEPVPTSKNHSDLEVRTEVKKAPLTITDDDVFSEVMSELLYNSKGVNLTVKAAVDVEMETALGKLVVREIPAEGVLPINPLGGKGVGSLLPKAGPKVGNLQIVETGPESLTLEAAVNFTNPTNYTASVPFFDLLIAVNDTLVGHATVRDVSVGTGNNTNMPIRVVWSPMEVGGAASAAVGRELLSQYISGYNTTLTFRMHNGSVPAQPGLGEALAGFEVTLPLPRIGEPSVPGDGDEEGDDKPHFIRQTTMHLFSSTAVFDLQSPFKQTILYITHLNATAMYHGDVVGKILHDESLEVPPGLSTTPRIPVSWDLGSVGYEALKNALGGTLKLSATANVGIRIGQYNERVWYEGKGIGAHIRI